MIVRKNNGLRQQPTVFDLRLKYVKVGGHWKSGFYISAPGTRDFISQRLDKEDSQGEQKEDIICWQFPRKTYRVYVIAE